MRLITENPRRDVMSELVERMRSTQDAGLRVREVHVTPDEMQILLTQVPAGERMGARRRDLLLSGATSLLILGIPVTVKEEA